MTEQDEIEFIRFVLKQGAGLIPDFDYSRPEPELLSNITQFRRARPLTRQFFLIRDDFFRMPLEMRRIEKAGRIVYYVAQRNGGPTIDFLGSGLFLREDERLIKPGSLSYYPTFFDTQENCFRKAPEELTRFFASLIQLLKSFCVRVKPKKVVFWISSNAVDELRGGVKLVGLEDLSAEQILGR